MAFKKAAVLLLALLCVQYGAAMERRTATHVHTSDARTEAFAAAMFDFVHSQYSFAHLLSEFTTCVVTPAKTFAQDPSSSAWRFAVTRGASEEDKASLLTKMAAFTTTQQQPYTDLIRSFSTVSVISSRLSSLVNSLLDGLATAFAVSQIMTEAKTEDRLTVPTENNPKVAEGMKEFAESIKKDPAAARTTFSKTIKFSILLEFLLPALDQFWSLLPYLGQFTIDTTVNQDLINSIFYNPKTTQFQWPKWLALLGFVSERDSDSRTCYQPLTGSSETAADMESIFRKLNAYAKTTVDTLTGAAKDVQESTEVLVKDNFLQFIAKLDQVSNEVTKFTEDMLHKWNAELNEDVKLLKYMLDERNCQSKNPETCDSICRKSLASCQQRRAQYELAQKLLNRNDICLMAADFNVQQNPAETTATTAKLVGKAKDKSTHVLFVLNGYLILAKPQRPQGSKYTVQGWSVRNVFNILRDGNLRIDFDEQADGSSLMKLMAFDHLIESFTLSKDRSEHFVESIKSINRVTGDDAFSLCLSSNNLRDAKMLQPFADAISDELRYKAEEAIGLRTRVFDQSQRSDVKRKGMSKANKKSGMQPAFTNQAVCEAAMLDQQSSSTVSSGQWCKEVSAFNPALCDIMTCVAEQNEKAVQLLLGPTYTRQSIEQSLDSLHHTSVVRQYTPPSITPPATAVCDTIDSFQALIQAEPRFNRINKCISCVFAVSNRYVFVPYHEGAVDLEGEVIQHEEEQSQTPKTAPVHTATEAETDETDTSTEVSQPVTETTEETSKKKKTTTAAKKKEKKKRAAARKKASAEHPTAEPKTEHPTAEPKTEPKTEQPKTEEPKTEHEEEDEFLFLLETQDLTRTRAHHFCTVVLQLRGENHRRCVRFIEGKATTTTTTTVDASTTATAAAADRFQPLVDIIKSFKEELESVQDQTKEALSICQQVDLCPTSCDFADFESPPPKTLSFSQDLTEEISKKTEEGIEQALQLGKQAQTEAQTDKSKPTIEAQSATPSESPKSEEEDD